MLLIDPGRTANSLRPNAASVPYVPREFRGQVTRVADFLSRAIAVERLLPVLLQEFAQMAAGTRRISASSPGVMLLEAAQAIAQGEMRVGQKLPASVTVIYRDTEEMIVRAEQCVHFPRERIAVDFLKQLLRDPASGEALTRAARDAGDTATMPGAGQAGDFAAWLAERMMKRKLALLPFAEGAHQIRIGKLRLVRIRHRVPTALKPDTSPPPPPLPPAPVIVQPTRTALPEAPPDVSPQARTLMDAARNGVPFCEECARAAAGLLGVVQPARAVQTALPALPAEVSAQAQVLMDAAKSGAPFCEECAKAAEAAARPVPAAAPAAPPAGSAQAQTRMDAARSGVPFCEECAKAAAELLNV